jgi:hypothetical protein
LLPFGGVYSIVGSLAMILITALTIIWLTDRPEGGSDAPDQRVAVDGGAPSV